MDGGLIKRHIHRIINEKGVLTTVYKLNIERRKKKKKTSCYIEPVVKYSHVYIDGTKTDGILQVIYLIKLSK